MEVYTISKIEIQIKQCDEAHASLIHNIDTSYAPYLILDFYSNTRIRCSFGQERGYISTEFAHFKRSTPLKLQKVKKKNARLTSNFQRYRYKKLYSILKHC